MIRKKLNDSIRLRINNMDRKDVQGMAMEQGMYEAQYVRTILLGLIKKRKERKK